MMATIQIKNKSRNFMFFGSLTLTGREVKTVDTKDLNDKEIATIANSISVGSLNADVEAIDVANEIKDVKIKAAVLAKLGVKVEAAEVVFEDKQDAPVEVVEVEVEAETEAETETEQEETVEAEEVPTPEEAKEKAIDLADLISGTAAEVKRKLKDVVLTDEEKLELVDLEKADKNRSSIVDLILAEGN